MQHMMCAIGRLLNYLVGALLERHRHVEAERLCGLEVDDQQKSCGLFDGQVARLGADPPFP